MDAYKCEYENKADYYNCFGFSTDIKPIDNNCTNGNADYPISEGSTFLELDTGKLFKLCFEALEDEIQPQLSEIDWTTFGEVDLCTCRTYTGVWHRV